LWSPQSNREAFEGLFYLVAGLRPTTVTAWLYNAAGALKKVKVKGLFLFANEVQF